jgi:hypothetical protein
MEPMSVRRASWIAHVKSWRDSDRSQADYCRRHALKSKTFAAWIKRCNTSAVPRKSVADARAYHCHATGRCRGAIVASCQWLAVGVAVRHRACVVGRIAAGDGLMLGVAPAPEQRDLFRETLEIDSAAIAAETEHRHEPASCSCGEKASPMAAAWPAPWITA